MEESHSLPQWAGFPSSSLCVSSERKSIDKMLWRWPSGDPEGTETRVTKSSTCVSQAPLGANPGIREGSYWRRGGGGDRQKWGPWPSFLLSPRRTLILGQTLPTPSKNRGPGLSRTSNPKNSKPPAFKHRWSSWGVL